MTQMLNLEQICADYLRDLQNQNPAAHVYAGSDDHIHATTIVAVGEGQCQHQEWILRQALVDTADSVYLEKHIAKYGIYRKTATFAGGKVRVRDAVGVTVSVGQQISVGNKVYLTAESVVVGALGSVEITVIATVVGSAQNRAAGSAATLQSVPAGIDSPAVLLTIVGGIDAKNDESLLARYEKRLRRPAADGNRYGSHNWCLEMPGVADAFIYSLYRGNGFAGAVILGENGTPGTEILTAVQAHIDTMRSVICKNGFLAFAPSIQIVNVVATITLSNGTDTDTAAAATKSAVNAYFGVLRPGDTLIKGQLETLISEVYGARDRVLTTPVDNIKPQESVESIYWPCPGNINVGYTT